MLLGFTGVITLQTHAYDLKGNLLPALHFCCKQRTPPRQVLDRSPSPQADTKSARKIREYTHVVNIKTGRLHSKLYEKCVNYFCFLSDNHKSLNIFKNKQTNLLASRKDIYFTAIKYPQSH